MKKNFTTPPNGAGLLTELTALDLKTDVSAGFSDFQKRPIFIDNCSECQPFKTANMTTKNADGFLSGITLGGLLETGGDIYGNIQETRQLELASEIERQRIERERLLAAQAQIEAQSKANTLKALTTPLLIGGVIIIAGIATYFIFRNKTK